jgi:tetratricopeptide (TPR) repeat protein
VRDHFARRAGAADQGQWHDLIREGLISLARRPGVRHPEDRATLDLVEEAIYHAGQAGQVSEAWALYEHVLGGLRHLGWKLGEPARGLRVLRGFEPCPDRWALGWYLRALGELEEAHRHNDLAYFRADVRLLQGRLPEAAAQGDDARAAVAAFLMGRSRELPPSLLGCAVPRAQVLLYLGRLEQAAGAQELGEVYRDLGWDGERARCRLILAEVSRRRGDAEGCRRALEKAAAWVLHAGSVEHLGLLHLVRARAARGGDGEAAQRAVSEGLHLARQCGLGLDHVELLCVQAEIMLDRGDAPAAERTAGEALWRAAAADCRFAWGEAEARHLLGQALAAQQRRAEARPVLEAALGLRQRLGDPRAAETERLLEGLCA